MKRLLMISMIVALALGMYIVTQARLPDVPQFPGARVSQTTSQSLYIQVATVDANDTDLAVTTSNWDDCKVSFAMIPAEWQTVTLSFYGYGDGDGAGSPDGATFSYKVYTVNQYGGAQLITTGTGTIGAQQMSVTPQNGTSLNSGAPNTSYCWCDTITEGTVYAERDVTYSNYAGADGVAEMHFKRYSAVGVYCVLTDMTTESVTTIVCVMNGFNL